MFTIDPSSINYLPTDRGVAYTANLLESGTKVGIVCNRGDGGDTFFDSVPRNTDVVARLHKHADEAQQILESYLEGLVDSAEGV